MTESQQKRICPTCGFISNMSDKVCPNDSTELQVMPEDPMIGKVVAKRYKIVGRLGRGGMSVVYKAHHQFMDRLVAIKMLRSELASDDDSLKRLQIESKAISALKHPNIVPVYDFGMLENDIPFLVMEYLEGEDLDRYIKTSAPISYVEAIPKFISICDGLEHAHQNGIIHRDIKPSNIILITENDGERVPVIVDFGIAKMVDLNGEDLNKLTATGQVFGSPLYMSPEQCSAKRPDARSDIYSVGCVMYLALTGQSPLKGNTPVDTMVKHIQASPKSFTEVLGSNDIPTKVELCVFKALEKDPDHRFSSMQEFSDALKNCMNSLSYNSFPSVSPMQKSAPAEEFTKSIESGVQSQPEIVSDIESSGKVEEVHSKIEVKESTSDTDVNQLVDDINKDVDKLNRDALAEMRNTYDRLAEEGKTKAPSKSKTPLIIGCLLLLVGLLFGAFYISGLGSNKNKSDDKEIDYRESVQVTKSSETKSGNGANGRLPYEEFSKVSTARFKVQPFISDAGWTIVEQKEQELLDPSHQDRKMKGVIYLVSFDYNNKNYEQVALEAFSRLKKRTNGKVISDTFDDITIGGNSKNRVKKQQIEYSLSGGKRVLSFVIYFKTAEKLRALQLVPTVDYLLNFKQQQRQNQITENLADDIIRFCFQFSKVEK